MNDSQLKARLAEAEAHFSHYRWDDAIACFEKILTDRPDHPAATQGWSDAVQQRTIDEELGQAVETARAALAEHRFAEALAALNMAQTRGALSHILKHHAAIDGLRTEAQEGQEWQRRVQTALREAAVLAQRRRLDQALEILDTASHELSARGWERLGVGLRQARDRLWTERNVDQRIQFAAAAFERQDYRLAAELAAALYEELPERDDVRRLHDRSRTTWDLLQKRLADVQEALTAARSDDAIAILANLRGQYPNNPEWQALWLRVHMDEGRLQVAAGRSAFTEHRFEDAATAFGAGRAAFVASLDVFGEHPTAAQERTEAAALHDATLAAAQAVRDGANLRWEPARHGWENAAARLADATAVRRHESWRHDFGEIAAVVGAMLGEATTALSNLEAARFRLEEGRRALARRDAGTARDSFRAGLALAERGDEGLKEQLEEGLRQAEQIQREVKKLMGRADHAVPTERLKLLRRAYERWETAPDLPARLAEELLSAAETSRKAGDEDAALELCDQLAGVTGAPAEALAAASAMSAGIGGRRKVAAAVDEAARLMARAGATFPPALEPVAAALQVLAGAEPYAAQALELGPVLAERRAEVQDRHERLVAAAPHLSAAERRRAAGDWSGAADAIAEARSHLGERFGNQVDTKLAEYRRVAEAIATALTTARQALDRAEALYAMPAEGGDLATLQWDALQEALYAAGRPIDRPPPNVDALPPEWRETRARLDDLMRRVEVIKAVHERIAAGRGVEALPIIQAAAGHRGDPVLAAVLARLLTENAGDAHVYATTRLAWAEGCLDRGDLEEAQAVLAEGRAYAGAAPEVLLQLGRLERRTSAAAAIETAATGGRAQEVAATPEAALMSYRAALEIAAGSAAGLDETVRRQIGLLLGLEEALWEEAVLAQARAIFDSLVAGVGRPESAGPVLPANIVIALTGWLRLATRASDLAFVTGQLVLGRDAAACERAGRVVQAHPGDRGAAAAYALAAAKVAARLLSGLRRRLARCRRLAGAGAYEAAEDELMRFEAQFLAPLASVLPDIAPDDALEDALEEAVDLRVGLAHQRELGARLGPVQEQVRAATLAGRYAEAMQALAQAEVIDPQREAAALWTHLDLLSALVLDRQQAEARSRLEVNLLAVEAALDLSESAADVRSALATLLAAQGEAHGLRGPEGERVRQRYAEVRTAALAARTRLPAEQAGALSRSRPHSEAEQRVASPPLAPRLAQDGHVSGGVQQSSQPGSTPAGALPQTEAPGPPPVDRSEPVRVAEDGDDPQIAALPEDALQAEVPALSPEEDATEDAAPVPFDIDDWLSNVTELAVDDEAD